MISFLLHVAFFLPIIACACSFILARRVDQCAVPYTVFALGGLALLGASLTSLLFSTTDGALALFPAVFGGIIGAGVFLASLYAIGYLPRYVNTYNLPWLAASYAAFIIGMEGVILASSVFYFLLSWEVMSLAAYFLIIADGTEESFRAGLMYIVMTQFGFFCIVSGFLILAGGDPFASWSDVARTAKTLSPGALAAALLLLFAGFGSKAGLVPLHQWLPYAHPQAPSHASALLSGVMLKVALFGFIESIALFPSIPPWFSLIVIGVGLLSGFFGALYAVAENDVKRLLAWSSIENIGLIFSALGVALLMTELPPSPITALVSAGALTFVVVHAINHFLFKSGLFMVAGAIVSETHTRDLDLLGGLARRWPFFSGVVLVLVLGAAALPPLGTFFGEWVYVSALATSFYLPLPFSAGAVFMLSIIGLTCGLALFAFVKAFSAIFLGRARSLPALHVDALSPFLVISPFIAAVALFVSGPTITAYFAKRFYLSDSLSSISFAHQFSSNPLGLIVLMAVAVLVILLVRKIATPHLSVRTTGTWDCGASLTPRMEETATGFAASIRFFFHSFLLTRKEFVADPIVPTNRWITTKRLSWSVASFWEQFLYVPLVGFIFRLSYEMRRLQAGVVQLYLLFILVTLVVVLSLSL